MTTKKKSSSLPGSLTGPIKFELVKTILPSTETQPGFYPVSLPYQITAIPDNGGSGVASITATAPLANIGTATDADIALTGVVAVAHGGTNSSTALNNNRVMVSSGGKIVETGPGTSSEVLVGTSPPSFGSVPAGALPFTLPLSVANGGTSSGAALNNNRAMVSSGGAIVESNSSTSSQVLVGGSPPAFGSVPSGALPFTLPLSISNGGTNNSAALNNNQVMVSAGGKIAELGAMTDGQLLIGSTASAPSVATPTGSNGLSWTPGAGTLQVTQTFGSDGSHAAAGNDTRFNPSPSSAGKVPFDTGAGYSSTAVGTTSQVLVGGPTPSFGAVPSGALPFTLPLSIANGGTNSGTAVNNNRVMLSIGGAIVESGASTTSQVLVGGTPPAFGSVPSGALPFTLPLSIANGGTNSSTGLSNNRAMVSSSGSIVESNASTTSQVLVGGSPPAFGSVPSGALPFTLPLSVANGGTNSGTALNNNRAMISVGGAIVESGASTTSQVLVGGTPPSFGSVPSGALPFTLPLSVANGGTNSAGPLSNKQLMVSSGGSIVELGAATNGQIPIGNTGNLPTLGVPTGANGLSFTTGAGTLQATQTFGTDSSHAAVGNDTRFNPSPSSAGRVPYDNGTGYSAAAAGTSSQVLIGGAAPSFGSVPAAAIPATTVSAGSYPTSGQIPTFTVGADGRLTAAGSTTTLTSPSISNPTFSGTEGGTRTIGGTPTLGVNLAAGGFKVTGLGAPTAASSDAATALYAEAQKTGSAIRLYTTANITANQYVGSFGQTSNATPSLVGGFAVPVAGKIKAIAVTGFNNAGASTTVTMYKSSDNGNTYGSTTLAVTVSSGTAGNTATGSVAVAANDMVIVLVDQNWTVAAGQWWQTTLQYIPD